MKNETTLKEILEFRQTVDLMQTEYPFSKLFGRADSRDACIASSAKVYGKLVNIQEGDTNLKFATLAEIATDNNGVIIQKKMKRLIDVFRPNKDKELTLLDFTRVSTSRDCFVLRGSFLLSLTFSIFENVSASILSIVN